MERHGPFQDLIFTWLRSSGDEMCSADRVSTLVRLQESEEEPVSCLPTFLYNWSFCSLRISHLTSLSVLDFSWREYFGADR